MSVPRLNEKYHNLGFEFFKDNDGSIILKYKGVIVFIIGSNLNVEDGMLIPICRSYLENMQDSVK